MFLRLTSSTLALAALAAPALALTPEEVWNAWVTEYGRTGYTVTEGTRDLAGDVLTLTDVAFVQQGEGDTLTISVPRIVLTATGDGNVRSDFGEAMAVELATRDAEDRPVTLSGTIRTPGMEVLSSGEVEARTDSVTAPSIVMTLDLIDLAEGDDPADVASVTLTDVVAEGVSHDGGLAMTSTSRVAKLDYTVDYADADGSLKAAGSIADLEGSSEVVVPDGATMDFAKQMDAALKAGATMDGTLSMGTGTHALDFTATATAEGESGAESGAMTAALDGFEVTFGLGRDGIAYQGAMSDLEVNMTGSGLPAPVSYGVAEATLDVQGPVMAAEAPAPFKFAYSLGGLTLGDEVWALFDPSSQLPRDPGSVDIDLTGQARLTADLFDPAWMEAAAAAGEPVAPPDTVDPEVVEADGPPMPFEVTEVIINQIAIEAAGARAEASGQLAAPEGGDISQPVGNLSARYQGLNTLLDTLVAMGVISQDEVMGYRMMLTMFARPGNGEDVLTTELQFNEGGEIIANGQKIK